MSGFRVMTLFVCGFFFFSSTELLHNEADINYFYFIILSATCSVTRLAWNRSKYSERTKSVETNKYSLEKFKLIQTINFLLISSFIAKGYNWFYD